MARKHQELEPFGVLPTTWGRYELQTLLGKGATSHVFRADLLGPAGFRKQVALKVLRRDDPDLRLGLLDEARLGARLHHTNLVDTYDVGTLDERVFIAMELVEGFTLRQLLGDVKPLPPAIALEITAQLLRALDHIHLSAPDGWWLQAVHRDVKPTNILINTQGEVKLSDLGVASALDLVDEDRARMLGSPPPGTPTLPLMPTVSSAVGTMWTTSRTASRTMPG